MTASICQIDDEKIISRILDLEIFPAVGCTEPAVIGFGTALAFNAAVSNLDYSLSVIKQKSIDFIMKNVKEVLVKVDRNVFKNSYSVKIPKFSLNYKKLNGAKIASIMGLCGDPSFKLKIFDSVVLKSNKLLDHLENKVKIEILKSKKQVVNVDVFVKTTKGNGRAVIKYRYDNVELVEANGKTLYNVEKTSSKSVKTNFKRRFTNLTIDDMINFVQKMPDSIKNNINKSIKINSEMSEIGIKNPLGLGLGFLLNNLFQEKKELASFIKAKTAAGVDARMSGISRKVMAVAQSGNMGLTATLPIVAYAEKVGLDEQLLVESVALSYLVTIHLAYNSSYTSAICGCSTKCGIGASAGLAYYMSHRNVFLTKKCVKIFIGNLPGVICDGAKYGCSLKAASAADAAYTSSLLALRSGDKTNLSMGLINSSVEKSVKNVCKIVEKASLLNKWIVEIMRQDECN